MNVKKIDLKFVFLLKKLNKEMCRYYKKCPYYCDSKQHHRYIFATIINNKNYMNEKDKEKKHSPKVNWDVYNTLLTKRT